MVGNSYKRNRKKVCRAYGKCAIILVGFYVERDGVFFSIYAIVCTLHSFSVATAVITSLSLICLAAWLKIKTEF